MLGASNIKAMNQRVAHLEYLYELDGRHHSDHPNHGHYTGLLEKYGKTKTNP